MVDQETVKLKIGAQIESLEKGLGWLKEGMLRNDKPGQTGNEKRGVEMIGQYERLLAALRAILTELD